MDSVGEGGNAFFGGAVRVKEAGGGRGCAVAGGAGGGCSGRCNQDRALSVSTPRH